jgi:oxygen-independent coproporphyrinogen-3 oxidase
LSLQDEYVNAMLGEIRLRAARRPGIRVSTLYFGGGTPSLLSAGNVDRIIRSVHNNMALPQNAEITLEANPGTVDEAELAALRGTGVNRLSFGVQSVHSDELLLLGRLHTYQEAVKSIQLARDAGFTNINIDLMYGLPGQSLKSWMQTLAQIINLEPDHLSLYALTLEPGTPLAETLMLGEIATPDPDLAADMYDAATSLLHTAGFWQYEISNWVKSETSVPDLWALPYKGEVESISPHICHHNVIYWRNESWIGIGAGAHSWLQGRRFSQHPHPKSYVNAVRSAQLKGIHNEVISSSLAQDETLMLGLRLVEGVTEQRFQQRFHGSMYEVYGQKIDKLCDFGLVTFEDSCLRLTIRARLLGNQIFQEFLR